MSIRMATFVYQNSLEQDRALYIASQNGFINKKQNLGDLIDTPEDCIDQQAIKGILNLPSTPINHTIWKNIVVVPPGWEISTEKIPPSGGIPMRRIESDFEYQDASLPHENILDTIVSIIREKVERDSINKIAVSLSGGCDSAGLLWAATQIGNIQVEAYTWGSNFCSSNEDVAFAKLIARNLGVPHYFIEIDPKDLFQIPSKSELLPSIGPPVLFQGFIKKFHSLIAGDRNSRVLILNGHGGDHVFLANPPACALYELILRGELKKFRTYASALTNIYGESLAELVFADIKFNSAQLYRWLIKAEAKSPEHQIGTRVDGRGKIEHKKQIIQAIIDNSTSKTIDEFNVLYPFTHKKIIQYAWHIAIDKLVGKTENRLVYRRDLRERINGAFDLRRDKGHITGAFQRSLKLKQNQMMDMVAQGYLSANRIINVKSTIKSLKAASNGAAGLNPNLQKVLSLELMLLAK